MRRVLLRLALLPALAAADYVDPYGLPSGSASLVLATQEDIGSGAEVEAFDVAADEVILASYYDQVADGLADLIFFELDPDSTDHYFRAPEGGDGFDRALIAQLGSLALEEIANVGGIEYSVTAPVVDGDAYLLLQIQAEAVPETTAVKFRVTNLDETHAGFDWVWQPNGSLYFEPSAAGNLDFGELKRRW